MFSWLQTICPVVSSTALLNDKMVEKTNAMISRLVAEQDQLLVKIEENRDILLRLMDPNNPIRTPGSTKEVVVKRLKSELALQFHQKDELQKQLNTLYATRSMIRESIRTAEMAAEMEFINKHMQSTMKISPARVIQNIDGLSDVRDNMHEINDAIDVSVSNAWLSDTVEYEEQVNQYLLQGNDDDENKVLLQTSVEDNLPIAPSTVLMSREQPTKNSKMSIADMIRAHE
jgi:lipopolysaccharide biosynthesis regulator YciM